MRNIHDVVNSAWEALGDAALPEIREWVTHSLTKRDERECAVAWLHQELAARARRATLQVERDASTVVTDLPTYPFEDVARQAAVRRDRAALRREQDDCTQAREERLAVLAKGIEAAVAAHQRSLDIAWTPDLRQQTIKMPDGTVTTWGNATVAQHRARVRMFTEYATANIEGAARHRKAIDDLTAAGAARLDDLFGAAA